MPLVEAKAAAPASKLPTRDFVGKIDWNSNGIFENPQFINELGIFIFEVGMAAYFDWQSSFANGNQTLNVVPFPSVDSTSIFPPWLRIIQ